MARHPRLVEESVVLIDGPWQHRQVSANGIVLHVAEGGDGQLVVLLHGFPQFWWTWRHQFTALVAAGFHVVAVDQRGYGATDKPPRGYDSVTLAADIAGLIRALGEGDAVVVGHNWGAHVAWTLGALHPRQVRRLVTVSCPHPLRWSRALATSDRQRRASGHALRFQVPWEPERWLVEREAANVGELLRRWGGPGYPDAEAQQRYQQAMLIRSVPHSSMEWYRWIARSVPRPDGRRYRRSMRTPIAAPVLQLHGSADPCILPATARGSDRWTAGGHTWIEYDGVGHFPHEEVPDRVTGDILDWLDRP